MDIFYIEYVKKSIENANVNISKITDDILYIHGTSDIGTLHFYNNIVSMPYARYLEIGTWKGSSVCTAMCNNKAIIVCMNNWSEFGEYRNEFLNNFNK